MARSYNLISSDSHVNAHATVYTDRVPARFRDAAPRVEGTPEGDYWFMGNRRVAPAVGLLQQAGKKFEEYKSEGGSLREARPGGWDPAERIKDMDLDGVDAQVMFSGHIGADAEDPELRLALLQAYNDWLGEFCSYAPDRFVGQAILPMWDMDLAIQEINRLANGKGIGGAIIPAYSPLEQHPYPEERWDPFWSTFEDVGWPASVHLGLPPRGHLHPMVQFSTSGLACAEPFSIIIFGGVLERHPRLKLLSVESGAGWWAYFLARADDVYERHRHWTKSTLPERPSTYFRRQMAATFQVDPAAMRCLDLIGEDNVLWADDYPHTDTTWPNSRKYVEQLFQGIAPDVKRKVVCENTGKLFGWIK
jgi:predicted TIM-barrel fold metal-dependent hydrolase